MEFKFVSPTEKSLLSRLQSLINIVMDCPKKIVFHHHVGGALDFACGYLFIQCEARIFEYLPNAILHNSTVRWRTQTVDPSVGRS